MSKRPRDPGADGAHLVAEPHVDHRRCRSIVCSRHGRRCPNETIRWFRLCAVLKLDVDFNTLVTCPRGVGRSRVGSTFV